MTTEFRYLNGLVAKWRTLHWLQLFLLALGTGLCVLFVTQNLIWASFWFTLTFAVFAILKKPWKLSLKQLCRTLDAQLPILEHSTELLLQNSKDLSVVAQLQQQKVAERLGRVKQDIRLEHRLGLFGLIAVLLAGLGYGLYRAGVTMDFSPDQTKVPMENSIFFIPMDTVDTLTKVPTLTGQQVHIRYPKYTKLSSKVSSEMNIQVLEGSTVSWQLQFDAPVDTVWLQIDEDSQPMKKNENVFSIVHQVQNSAVYNFKFQDGTGRHYLSEVYALQMMSDVPPEISIPELRQFSSFEYDQPAILQFTCKITDDFGIADAAIVATVSKGSGESVKFREARLAFDHQIAVGAKTISLNKQIDLKKMKMEVGDELYFYVEAKDAKTPHPNIARSETYFAVIKDTLTDVFSVESTMAADLMPDYFRSQRQLILDTEKLIKQRGKIKAQEFNFTSNELGYDQKALRLKYGRFMGDETEVVGSSEAVQMSSVKDGGLDAYTHDHDGDNEHHLVEEEHDHDHDHEHEHEHDDGNTAGNGQGQADPLEAYVHNHSDPEASTLFAKSLKAMLKEAMTEMWDAELYLRLYEPEKSLPYQYKALKRIQEIKNSARIYVHRIGFDPPPIKETQRLTGDLDKIGNVRRISEPELEDNAKHIKYALKSLDPIFEKGTVSKEEQRLFVKAGNELARLAIEQPGKYLQALQFLKLLAQAEDISDVNFKLLAQQLYDAIPNKPIAPNQGRVPANTMNQLFLEQLSIHGQ